MRGMRNTWAAVLMLLAMTAGAQQATDQGTPAPAPSDQAAPAAPTAQPATGGQGTPPAPAASTAPAATAAPGAAPATGAPASDQASFSSAAFGRPRYMIYFFQAEQDTLSATQEFVLYNSILAAVAEANRDVVILESPDRSVPAAQEGKEELARRINADSWLSVVASGGFSNPTIQVETYDILRQKTYGQEIIRPGFVVDYRTISMGFWDNLAQAIKDNYARVVDLSTLTVHGRPGTTLDGIPGGPYTVDQSGTWSRQVPYPSAFTVHARAGGYYDVDRPLFLGIEPQVVDLGQVKKPFFGAEINLSSLQFPGFRAWFSIIPASVFARVGITTQLVGVYLIDNAPGLLVTGAPLSLVQVDGGIYLNPPEQLLRFYVAAGGYLRVTHPPAPSFALDEAAAGAITISLGGEFSPSRRIRFVADYQPAFILAPDPNKFISQSFVPNSFPSGSVPGYVVLSYGLFDLRNLYIGMRIDF